MHVYGYVQFWSSWCPAFCKIAPRTTQIAPGPFREAPTADSKFSINQFWLENALVPSLRSSCQSPSRRLQKLHNGEYLVSAIFSQVHLIDPINHEQASLRCYTPWGLRTTCPIPWNCMLEAIPYVCVCVLCGKRRDVKSKTCGYQPLRLSRLVQPRPTQ